MKSNIELSVVKNRGRKISKLPCLKLKGNRVFAATADQRFMCGTEEFLRTHFPIKLQYRRSSTNQLLEVSEEELLAQLLEAEEATLGNRIFVLYGAAGSGKSELMRWLQTQIGLQDGPRSEVTIRISRTELDIFQITQRFQQFQTSRPLHSSSLQRWEECRQKPRTLAKILVLTALEQLLDSDEQISSIYYQLIDIVQNNLEGCFTKIKQTQELQPLEDLGHFIELFSREDLQGVLRDSVVPVPIEYETLRYHLLKVFREQLLEGLHIPGVLHQIAERIYTLRQQRPILLIDDLVQSINIFATDLLDYFVTLEEGCWDVVIGITPGSLEATARGKELLARLNFLDTIDDRVEKLWLSDEHGFSSSFLNETNCVEYARNYITEYKRQNKRPCNSTCPAFAQCQNLNPDEEENLLTPFNRELLVRLFRSLPTGKGKARYFNLYLRDILKRVAADENLLEVLAEYVKPEQAVYQLESNLAQAYEFYGPFVETVQELEYKRLNDLGQFFRLKIPSFSTQKEISPVVTSLLQTNGPSKSSPPSAAYNEPPSPTLDPGKQAIKAWLSNNPVNKQLLRNLRRGIVRAVKDFYPLDILTRPNTANPTRVLRWGQTRLETVPPVSLEGVDDFEGLEIARPLGPLAYTLYDFADSTGSTETRLRESLVNNATFPPLLFHATDYHQKIRIRIEAQLGVKLEELAFCLLTLAGGLSSSTFDLPSAVAPKIQVFTPLVGAHRSKIVNLKYPASLEAYWPGYNTVQLTLIRRLFDDCFKLRENVYDGFLLEEMINRFEAITALRLLLNLDLTKIDPDFRLNDEQFGSVLVSLLQPLGLLQKLKADLQTHTSLVAACERAGLLVKAASSEDTIVSANQLVQTICPTFEVIENIQTSVSTFLDNCDLLTLHRSLILAQVVEQHYQEQFLAQFQAMFLDFELDATKVASRSSKNEKPVRQIFSDTELALLASFAEHSFRLPLSHFPPNFLAKIAQHFPPLYQQIELLIGHS